MKLQYIEHLTKYLIKKKGLNEKEAEAKAEESWEEYYKANKEKVKQTEKKLKEDFKRSVEKEFINLELSMDD